MTFTPSTEDRIWAAFSHLSSLGLGMGILLPIICWSERRRTSNYASFQSLQALGYQSLGYTVWLLSYLIVLIVVSVILIAMGTRASQAGQNFESFFRSGMTVVFVFVFGFMALYFLLPIVGAVACAFGKDFRYPIMGSRLARYLAYDPAQTSQEPIWLNEDHEFRWVSAMGHFSVLIILWGLLAPLTTWMLYGKRSLFLKFQSIQTILYQTGTTVLYFVGIFIYLFAFLFLFVGMGMSGSPNLNSSQGLIGILGFGLLLLISIVLILIVPLLHILGQWAGYRVLKGDNYRYPLIGKSVEKWITNQTPRSEDSRVVLKGEGS